MAWADIFKWTSASGTVYWRVYLGTDSCESEDDATVEYVVKRLKPFLDLIEPTPVHAASWVKWRFSKEEYNAMMGDSDGSE